MVHHCVKQMYHEARDMLRKAKLPKNGHCQNILERWYKDAKYRADLSEHGWTEGQIRQHDALALEDHFYVATPEERSRCKKPWKFSLNREEIQGPIEQRLIFVKQSRNT